RASSWSSSSARAGANAAASVAAISAPPSTNLRKSKAFSMAPLSGEVPDNLLTGPVRGASARLLQGVGIGNPTTKPGEFHMRKFLIIPAAALSLAAVSLTAVQPAVALDDMFERRLNVPRDQWL